MKLYELLSEYWSIFDGNAQQINGRDHGLTSVALAFERYDNESLYDVKTFNPNDALSLANVSLLFAANNVVAWFEEDQESKELFVVLTEKKGTLYMPVMQFTNPDYTIKIGS
jgi:hypothetical protein